MGKDQRNKRMVSRRSSMASPQPCFSKMYAASASESGSGPKTYWVHDKPLVLALILPHLASLLPLKLALLFSDHVQTLLTGSPFLLYPDTRLIPSASLLVRAPCGFQHQINLGLNVGSSSLELGMLVNPQPYFSQLKAVMTTSLS